MTRVIGTHLHPDHVGMAGWLTQRFGCRLWITRLDYLHCKAMVSDTGREAPPDAIRFYQRAGWDEDAIARYRGRFGRFGRMFYHFPDSFRRIAEGESLLIGAHVWHVVIGRGHTPEHACLLCPALQLLISGDQVLPRISSNVSVHPTEPDANPLGEWLDSIRALRAGLPGEVLVLPAHNEPFYGLHARLTQLELGVEGSLGRLREALQQPRRVIDVFTALFRRDIPGADANNYGLASGEAIAHLNYLLRAGEAVAEADADGVLWYRLA
ncbi:Metallo-beta-lactamase superfamily protein [compost metagenome]